MVQNKMKSYYSNSTFGKPYPQAEASFAKRAISADPHSRSNWSEIQITNKENPKNFFNKIVYIIIG
jgi:hypothetical protein